MKLKYRGITYDYIPPQLEMTSTAEVGQYRGLEWRFRKPKQVTASQPTLDLMYRGVAYQTGAQPAPVADAVPVAAAPAVTAKQAEDRPSAETLARALMVSHHQWIKSRQQSLLSRTATEVGLSSTAAHYWNHIQGKIHPSFRIAYDRSHVALS
ncbi:MAG: DUF4278 domain-containing protein [Acaryochloridaceae cyanobacterium SU_2_1]|nr:DUF4278 domain-containing protein [Acaryochloridaceae cyanobacterium SU_2_1]